jgi:hypothetical protein
LFLALPQCFGGDWATPTGATAGHFHFERWANRAGHCVSKETSDRSKPTMVGTERRTSKVPTTKIKQDFAGELYKRRHSRQSHTR